MGQSEESASLAAPFPQRTADHLSCTELAHHCSRSLMLLRSARTLSTRLVRIGSYHWQTTYDDSFLLHHCLFDHTLFIACIIKSCLLRFNEYGFVLHHQDYFLHLLYYFYSRPSFFVAGTLLGFFFTLSPWIGRVVFEARGKWRLQLFLLLICGILLNDQPFFFLARAIEGIFYEICNDAKISSWALSAGSAVALRRRRLVLLFSFTHQGFGPCGVVFFFHLTFVTA
jgi:hypothetical protein